MALKKLDIEVDFNSIEPLSSLLDRFFVNNESVTVLQTLFASEKTMVELVEIRRTGRMQSAEDIEKRRLEITEKYGLMDFEILGMDSTEGKYTAIVKHRTPEKISPILRELADATFLASPLKIVGDRALMSVLVEENRVKEMTERLSQQGIYFKIRSIGKPAQSKFQGISSVQLYILKLAKAMGYFDVPRRASTADVARMAGVTAPAVSKAIRRAERTLVERLLEEKEFSMRVS
jgi:predicted DNA binding protein